MHFLQSFQPEAVLIQVGPLTIYWYGLLIVLGIVLGLGVSIRLSKRFGVPAETLIDAAFWTILWAIIGARLYHILIHYGYYLANPLEILFVWQGGLAIHGGLIGGGLALIIYCRRHRLDLFAIAALYAPALALGQAIGRWGNYFNQELYGYPTGLPWGIPIETVRRLPEFISSEYFHPTFLYESIGNFLIFLLLIILFFIPLRPAKLEEKQDSLDNTGPTTAMIKQRSKTIIFSYLISYSLLRFITEFFRVDPTPELFGLRFPQIISLIIITIIIGLWITPKITDLKRQYSKT